MKLLKLWSAELSIEHGQGSRTKERGTMDVIKFKHTITAEEGGGRRERVVDTYTCTIITCICEEYLAFARPTMVSISSGEQTTSLPTWTKATQFLPLSMLSCSMAT